LDPRQAVLRSSCSDQKSGGVEKILPGREKNDQQQRASVVYGLTLPDYSTALDGASCSNIDVNTKMLGWLTKRTIMNSAGKSLKRWK